MPPSEQERREDDEGWVYTEERVVPHSLCCDECKKARAALSTAERERDEARGREERYRIALERIEAGEAGLSGKHVDIADAALSEPSKKPCSNCGEPPEWGHDAECETGRSELSKKEQPG